MNHQTLFHFSCRSIPLSTLLFVTKSRSGPFDPLSFFRILFLHSSFSRKSSSIASAADLSLCLPLVAPTVTYHSIPYFTPFTPSSSSIFFVSSSSFPFFLPISPSCSFLLLLYSLLIDHESTLKSYFQSHFPEDIHSFLFFTPFHPHFSSVAFVGSFSTSAPKVSDTYLTYVIFT